MVKYLAAYVIKIILDLNKSRIIYIIGVQMDKNKIIIIVLIAIIAIFACLIASTLISQGNQDNIITVDGITFNTTNATDFMKKGEKNETYYHIDYYSSENGTGKSYVNILDFSQFSDSQNNLFDNMLNSHKNAPSQTINGIIVYTESVTTGEDVGAPVYVSFIKNNDLKKLVIVGSRDANETAKMASSLKFN